MIHRLHTYSTYSPAHSHTHTHTRTYTLTHTCGIMGHLDLFTVTECVRLRFGSAASYIPRILVLVSAHTNFIYIISQKGRKEIKERRGIRMSERATEGRRKWESKGRIKMERRERENGGGGQTIRGGMRGTRATQIQLISSPPQSGREGGRERRDTWVSRSAVYRVESKQCGPKANITLQSPSILNTQGADRAMQGCSFMSSLGEHLHKQFIYNYQRVVYSFSSNSKLKNHSLII